MNLDNNRLKFQRDTGWYNMMLAEEENILALKDELKSFRKKYKQGMKINGGEQVQNYYKHQ